MPRDPDLSEVVQRLVPQLLAQLDDLTARCLALITERVPACADGTVDRGELITAVRVGLERGILALVEHRLRPEADALAHDTGTLRARQGVHLETLLRAYRLGGRTIWEAIVSTTRATGGEMDADRLLDVGELLWQVIDDHSAAVATTYRAEEARLRGQGLRRQQAILDGLLDGRGADLAFAEEAARILDMPADGRLLCVVALVDEASAAPLRSPQSTLVARRIASAWHIRGDRELGLVALGPRSTDEVRTLLQGCAAGRVGLAPPIEGFADAAMSFRQAELCARTLPEGSVRVAALKEPLPEALLVDNPGVVACLLEETVAPLLRLPATAREDLLATMEALVAEDGFHNRAATRLGCHRNTLSYRLRKVETLTGRGLRDVRDMDIWRLSLTALRQGGLGT